MGWQEAGRFKESQGMMADPIVNNRNIAGLTPVPRSVVLLG